MSEKHTIKFYRHERFVFIPKACPQCNEFAVYKDRMKEPVEYVCKKCGHIQFVI